MSLDAEYVHIIATGQAALDATAPPHIHFPKEES